MGKKQKKPQRSANSVDSAGSASVSFRTPVVAIVALLLIFGAASFWFYVKKGRLTTGAYRDYNVLLITLDTTRADRLGMYGYNQDTSPNLDRLAKKSYVFEDAISHVPLTLPSHTSMLTGLLPVAHGVRDNVGFFLSQKVTTLPELLKSKGYSTSAFVSAFILDSRWQLNQGFDLYYDNFDIEESSTQLNPQDVQRTAEETETEFEHWLEENKNNKFFSWIHFYDPHDPYEPPEPYKSKYPDFPYNGEIAYMDEQIGKLLKKLDALGLTDKTIIVVTGDHGESLGEHSELTHAMFVYNTTLHVPLFISVPGTRPSRVRSTVRHIDLTPTILDLLGIPVPGEVQGTSLIPLINKKKEKERVAYSESIYAEAHYGWSPLKSVTTPKYKYIDAPRPELYDRLEDPGELRNLFTEKQSYGKALHEELESILTKYSRSDLTSVQKMDPETEEKLRALGYIGSSAIRTEESSKIDPKDKIHLAKAMQLAFFKVHEKQYEKVLEVIMPALQEDPNLIEGHFVASVALISLKRYDEAIDELLKTVARRPDHTMALYNLAYTYEMTGNLPESETWYKKILQYEPGHLFANQKLGHLYRMRNQPELAKPYFLTVMKHYEESLRMAKTDKSKSTFHEAVGEFCFATGDPATALDHYRAAVELTPDRKTLHYNLAQVYEAVGAIREAVASYRREVELDSTNYKAFNNLGLIYRRANQLEQAAYCFQKVVELDPEESRGYLLLASTLKQMGREADADRILQQARQQENQ